MQYISFFLLSLRSIQVAHCFFVSMIADANIQLHIFFTDDLIISFLIPNTLFRCNVCFTAFFRNRRAREASILQSIENGARTLFDIVSRTYADVDRKFWIPASFNVRLHVEHLNSQHKLPKVSEIVLIFYMFHY